MHVAGARARQRVYRRKTQRTRGQTQMSAPAIRRVAYAMLPTRYGKFTMIVYNTPGGKEHVALTAGHIPGTGPVLVRLHSECLTGDVFGPCRCDCGEQLDDSRRYLHQEGWRILLYLRQAGRRIGLT